MMPASRLLLLLPFLAACGTVREWNELETEPMTLGACYDGLTACAQGARFVPDNAHSDRGLGELQSRWRRREVQLRGTYYPVRNRLIAEIKVDEGSSETGWRLRYYIEQETVKDLSRHSTPQEDDWSADGQDREGEMILGAMLERRLAPKSVLTEPRRNAR
ncbi:MAG: hypothetical protein H6835_00440 [Planctomycetes bacterium]|nr:hypothetical protein [Planctomycetota bacterium]